MPATITPQEFVARWRGVTLTERSASQSHFLNLCALLGEPIPVEADPTGEWYTFERGAKKDSGGSGWADVWKRGFFGWEYKGPKKDLNAALAQLQRYADGIDETTPHISWSMAKSVLQAVVGLLVGDGRLDLQARCGLAHWSEPGDPRSAITLDQLLTMRSGLRFVEDYVDDQKSDVIEMLFGRGKADVAAYAAALPLDHAPGSFFSKITSPSR